MSKTIHDDVYEKLLVWLKSERERRNVTAKGDFTMRALAPRLARLLGRPGLTFSWIAKVEQGDRRLDILEYAAYCLALGIDPHEGLCHVVKQLRVENAPLRYPPLPPSPVSAAADQPAGQAMKPGSGKRHLGK